MPLQNRRKVSWKPSAYALCFDLSLLAIEKIEDIASAERLNHRGNAGILLNPPIQQRFIRFFISYRFSPTSKFYLRSDDVQKSWSNRQLGAAPTSSKRPRSKSQWASIHPRLCWYIDSNHGIPPVVHGPSHGNVPDDRRTEQGAGAHQRDAAVSEISPYFSERISRPPTCLLCPEQHDASDCTTYPTIGMRLVRMQVLGICPNCLQNGCVPQGCNVTPPSCEACGQGVRHHTFVCPLTEATREPEVPRQKEPPSRAAQATEQPSASTQRAAQERAPLHRGNRLRQGQGGNHGNRGVRGAFASRYRAKH